MCSGTEEGSYLRLIDCVSLNFRLESNKEEERRHLRCGLGVGVWRVGFGVGVQDLLFEVWDLKFGCWGLGLRLRGSGVRCMVWGLEFKV